MVNILLLVIVCVFCFIVGMMIGYWLGLPKYPKPKAKEQEHFEAGGMYIG